jgi:Cu/Ag efflux protein CusF
MRISLLLAAIVSTFALVQPVVAQTSNTITRSEPGKVAKAQTVEATLVITGIDKASRTLKFKGPQGNEAEVVAGPDVKNFDQLKVGDSVNVAYVEALVVELKKGGGLKVERTDKSAMAQAKPGETPQGGVAKQVTAVGDVTKVDAATQTITVKGPQRTVELKVRDSEQFKLIKVGDQLEVTYTTAVALSVAPAPKK